MAGATAKTLQFGAIFLEFDAEIDACDQYPAVKAVTWDAAQQQVLTVDGAPAPGLAGLGNRSSDDLAGVAAADSLQLRHGALARGRGPGSGRRRLV